MASPKVKDVRTTPSSELMTRKYGPILCHAYLPSEEKKGDEVRAENDGSSVHR